MSGRALDYQKEVKVRKDHICQGCGKKINKGEISYYTTVVDGGDICSFYECDKCLEFRKKHCQNCKDRELFCIGENYMIGTLRECDGECELGHYD